MLHGSIDKTYIYLEFTRTLPAIVTYGPAGLNASIKMVGIVPKEEYIETTLEKIVAFASKKPSMEDVLNFLLDEIYRPDVLDFSKLFTLDLAKKNTWTNINESNEAILIFFTPPETSYMVCAKVTIHTNDIYFEYANAMHDIFHAVPRTGKISLRAPTYIFHIMEIWDKSAKAFGKKIYEKQRNA